MSQQSRLYAEISECPLKPRLIQPTNRDPDTQRLLESVYRVTEWIGIILASAKWKLAIASVIFIGLPAVIAQTGIFSYILLPSKEGLAFSGSTATNSQNMELLHAAKNFDPNPSKGGGEITIIGGTALLSETGPSGSLANIEDYPKSDQISIYVVREGDSLSQIAEMFGVTTNTIIWGNDIPRGSEISVGQVLVILPVSGVRHSVVTGDTIASIAKKYGGDIDEIVRYNNIEVNAVLTVGHIVIIPDGEVAAPVYNATYNDRVAGSMGSPSSADGYYLRPIDGGVRSQGLHGYNGIDLAAGYGTSILAAATGDVIVSENSGWNGGYGQYVVIKHDNGTQTLYAHASEVIVDSGQRVVKGQVIGYVGSTGKSTGAHLHFEVRGAKNPF